MRNSLHHSGLARTLPAAQEQVANGGSLVGSSRDLAPGARAAELVSYDDGEGSGRVLVSEGNHRRKKQRIVVFKKWTRLPRRRRRSTRRLWTCFAPPRRVSVACGRCSSGPAGLPPLGRCRRIVLSSSINGAAGLLKFRASAAQARRPRDDGLTPQQLAKQFRFTARARIQAAILKGNSLIASAVGL